MKSIFLCVGLALFSVNAQAENTGSLCEAKTDIERIVDPCCQKGYVCKAVRKTDQEYQYNVRSDEGAETYTLNVKPTRLILKDKDRRDSTELSEKPKKSLFREAVVSTSDGSISKRCFYPLSSDVVRWEIPVSPYDKSHAYLLRKEGDSRSLYAVRPGTQNLGAVVSNGQILCGPIGKTRLARMMSHIRAFAIVPEKTAGYTSITAVSTSHEGGKVAIWRDQSEFPGYLSDLVTDFAINQAPLSVTSPIVVLQLSNFEHKLVLGDGFYDLDREIITGDIRSYLKERLPDSFFKVAY